MEQLGGKKEQQGKYPWKKERREGGKKSFGETPGILEKEEDPL